MSFKVGDLLIVKEWEINFTTKGRTPGSLVRFIEEYKGSKFSINVEIIESDYPQTYTFNEHQLEKATKLHEVLR